MFFPYFSLTFPKKHQISLTFPDPLTNSDFPGVETLPLLVEIPRSKMKTHQKITQKLFFGGGGTKKRADHVCDHLGIYIEYTYISEFIL